MAHLLGIVLVVTVTVAVAGSGPARAAAACANETVSFPSGKLTLRFVLHGNVGCAEAHRTMRAYGRALREGRCPTRICTEVEFAGGWTCSVPSAAEELPSGPIAGCERSNASFEVHKARKHKAGTLHLSEFRSPDKLIGCLISQFEPPGYGLLCNALSGHAREGSITKDGKVSVCNRAHIGDSCSLGFPRGPVLAYGKRTEAHGYRCTSKRNGLTCVRTRAPGKGKGFRISTDAAVRVG